MLTINGVEMIGVREAAALVGRTPETIRRWVWSHKVEATKHGNRLMLKRADLVNLVDDGSPMAADVSEVSLGAWAAKVARTNTQGRPGASASDLVADNRAERQHELLHASR